MCEQCDAAKALPRYNVTVKIDGDQRTEQFSGNSPEHALVLAGMNAISNMLEANGAPVMAVAVVDQYITAFLIGDTGISIDRTPILNETQVEDFDADAFLRELFGEDFNKGTDSL